MSSSVSVFTVVTTKLNAGQSAANAGAGAQNSDGSTNGVGMVLGTTQAIHGGVELATLGQTVGKWIPFAGLALSLGSVVKAYDDISSAARDGQPINQSDLAALVGGIAGMGGAAIVLVGASGPIVVGLGAAALTTSVAAGSYQLYAQAKGLTWDPASGRSVEVALTAAQMVQIDQHLQQTLPLWNDTRTLSDLGFAQGAQVQTVGSVFSGVVSDAALHVQAPAGLDTPTRNSTSFIQSNGAHTAEFNAGGGIDDLWVIEKNAGRYLGSREQFRADFVASNPGVDPASLGVQQGQTYYVPERGVSGGTVYHYANGASIRVDGTDYHMVLPNADGGQTIYSRTYVGDVDGPSGGLLAQYEIKQVSTNADGEQTYSFTGQQKGLSGDVAPSVVSTGLDTDGNGHIDQVQQTIHLAGGVGGAGGSAGSVVQTRTDVGANGSWDTSYLNMGPVIYNLADLYQLNKAEYQLNQLWQQGHVQQSVWNDFTRQNSWQLLGGGSFQVDYGLVPAGSGAGWGGMGWSNPIGAFYDSQSAAHDTAASIASYLPVAQDAQGKALTAQQLSALDTNRDGSLSVAEAQTVRLWRDLNENGRVEVGESTTVAQAVGSDRFQALTRAGGRSASASDALAPLWLQTAAAQLARPVAPSVVQPVSVVPASNYNTLRTTDELFFPPAGGYMVWQPSQIKINFRSPHVMVGTLGNDNFDASYYGAYGSWFNLSLLTHFLAGPGNDVMGGSVRNDHLWGGTGNDVLFGYAGADRIYGEEDNDQLYGDDGDDGDDLLDGGIGNDVLVGGNGNDQAFGGLGDDELQGQAGHDQLLGQAGNDRLFGQAGNDRLWGGDGNDLLIGYKGSNENQALLAGETDDDQLWGEGGNDDLYGGLGNDTLDGGVGDDNLLGEAGDDKLFGGAGADELQGGLGNDQLLGEAGNDSLFGQVGNDTLWGGDGDDVLVGFTASNELQQTLQAGQTDDDVLMGEAGHDNLYGGWGNDLMDGGVGDDLLLGDAGDDRLWGGAGHDELQGGAGNDQLMGDDGDDRLFGQLGNDQLWGGAGNDVLVGFNGANEVQQTLYAGQTDDDVLYGGAGNDLMVGGLGNDELYGGADNDELQGGEGNDLLLGDAGNDVLFGQVGNDVLYGGDGDDYLMGFTASNEAQQSLLAGQTDDDQLFGGAGRDTLVGAVGNDYLDGGAGADVMVGGVGNDTYIVNSVNDVVYEQAGEGHDTVLASTSYLLNAQVEDLVLLEGFATHGTGNSLNNRIVGNSADNILDGVTGADTMVGGLGNDTYYVDDTSDTVVELTGQGTDTVQSSVSLTLADNVENLRLLDFGHPEKGLVDGQSVLVYGYPKRNELDYMQGDAVPDYQGTCALTSIANLMTQAGRPTTESQVVQLAIRNNWAVNNPALPAHQLGGSNVHDQQAILQSYNLRSDVIDGYNEVGMAQLLRSGRGVILAVNAGRLWGETAYIGDGTVNHAVTLTGAVYGADDGQLKGFYLTDSGRGRVDDMTRFVDVATFRQAAQAPGAYAIYTLEPVKFWNEDIAGAGNALDNQLQGNRGNNWLSGMAGHDVLAGGEGNDTLIGGAGNDRYLFARGDGQDHVDQTGSLVADNDVIEFAPGIASDQLWFRQVGLSLEIGVAGTSESLTVDGWFQSADRQVDAIKAGDGRVLQRDRVDALVQAMADFAPPAPGQLQLQAQAYPGLAPVLAASWT